MNLEFLANPPSSGCSETVSDEFSSGDCFYDAVREITMEHVGS